LIIGSTGIDAVMDEELPALIQYFRTGMIGPITAPQYCCGRKLGV
jgi:hypothetical protein